MVTPAEYVGNLMELAYNRRGEFVKMKYLTGAHALHGHHITHMRDHMA
jgi:translation elongation factor EF-4